MLENLIKEMAVAKITNEDLSKAISAHRNTIANKLNGISNFSIDEAFTIQKTFFPNLDIAYLFAHSDGSKESWKRVS